MDKVMKAEIRARLDSFRRKSDTILNYLEMPDEKREELLNNELSSATSSLTTLIIKWLEGKRVDILDHHEKYHIDCHRCIEILARNQLITELVEELND